MSRLAVFRYRTVRDVGWTEHWWSLRARQTVLSLYSRALLGTLRRPTVFQRLGLPLDPAVDTQPRQMIYFNRGLP